MIGFDFTEEQLANRALAREFAEREMKPFAAEIDGRQDGSFDWAIVRRFAKAKLNGLLVPSEFGGAGTDYVSAMLVSEEMGAACLGQTVVCGGTWLASTSVRLVGTDFQKEKYLSRLCEPEGNLAAFAATEADAGSDIAALKTTAARKSDRYVLNGRKHYITNVGVADFYVVMATTDAEKRHAGITAFIVDGDAAGLSVGRIEDKMGLRAARNGELVLEDVEVPVENMLGRENAGFLVMMQTLDTSRPCLGAASVGLARAAFEAALAYSREREQYGRPLFNNQGISFPLADMAIEIDAARLLALRAAWLIDTGRDATLAASACKVYATEMAERVCGKALEIHGAVGYSKDLPLEKYYRDAKAMAIFEGANQVQRIIIGSML